MKRLLRRKAGFEPITLYHVTSSQLFLKMLEDGFLLPGSYTEQQTRPKTNFTLRDLAKNNSEESEEISVLTLIKEESDYQISEKLKTKINDIIEETKNKLPEEQRNNENTIYRILKDIYLNVTHESKNPSSDIGVYLTNEEHNEYYLNKVNGTGTDDNLPVFPVELKVKVYEDALSPDLYEEYYNGDTSLDRDSDVPLWKQSLEVNGEVIHQGPIDLDNVESIYFHLDFFENHHTFNDKTYEEFNEKYEGFNDSLSILEKNKWLTFDKGVEEITTFYESISEQPAKVEKKFPNESKIIRFIEQDHNNYYGDDVYYTNLTQEEYQYINDFESGRDFNIVMIADSNIYYGFSGLNVEDYVLRDFHPEIVIELESMEVYCANVEDIQDVIEVTSNFITNPEIYVNSNSYWVDSIDKSLFNYKYDFNNNEFIKLSKKQSRLKKRIIK